MVLALVAAGIAASNLRDDDRPALPSAAGLADPASTRRGPSAACGTSDGDAVTEPAETRTVDVDGTERSYRITAAAPLEPGAPRPLVVLAGDAGESVDQLATAARVDQLANALQLVVVVLAPAAGVP